MGVDLCFYEGAGGCRSVFLEVFPEGAGGCRSVFL